MQKNSKMPVHCTTHHHHQLGFFSTPTPIKDSVGDDGGEEACSAGRAVDGAALFDLLKKGTCRDRDIGRSMRLWEIRMNEARPYL